jgi:hypothetical protein
MKVLDPGHYYQVDVYDNDAAYAPYVEQVISFMKREGDGYPGNVGHHAGTNCQELIRVLIDRVYYLDNQIPHENNLAIIRHLQASLWLFEDRATERHKLPKYSLDDPRPGIELEPTCTTCGHIVCKGHKDEAR